MFHIFGRKFRFFSRKDVDEINLLSTSLRKGNFEDAADYPINELKPKNSTYDSIKLILILIAHVKLLRKDSAIVLSSRVFFEDGLYLYEKKDREYLEKYVEFLLRGNFGESLSGFPDSIRRLRLKRPDLDEVDEYLKQLFVLEIK